MTTVPDEHLRYLHRDIETNGLHGLRNDPFYLITCRLVLAFVTDKPKLISDVARHLAPDGRFVLITPLLEDVLVKQQGIAVDRHATQALLEGFFTVDFARYHGDARFICKPV